MATITKHEGKGFLPMTNKEKLQELEDILHRKIEGDFDYEVLKKRLELLLLIAQIKKTNR